MPELPEVETVARELHERLGGRSIRSATLTAHDLYRKGSLPLEETVGRKIRSVGRIGKAIQFHLGEDLTLVVHLGMTGRLIYGGLPTGETPKHLHALICTTRRGVLQYHDSRRFGFFYVGPADGIRDTLNMGLDPFEIRPAGFASALRGRRAPVKSLLLDQRFVSGVGNIYADEALFRAGIHPETAGGVVSSGAERLLRCIRVVLRRAIRAGGTTFRDYRRTDGDPGGFQTRLAVYGREGERCRSCGAAIERVVLSARSAYYCPRCQRRHQPRSG